MLKGTRMSAFFVCMGRLYPSATWLRHFAQDDSSRENVVSNDRLHNKAVRDDRSREKKV